MKEITIEEKKKEIKKANFLTFLLGFGQALLIYVISSFFKEASATENVGVFYLAAYAVQLFIFFHLHRLVSYLGLSRTFLFIVFLKIPLLAVLAAMSLSFFSIFVLILYLIISSCGWVVLDMILEACSQNRFSGRIRGINLTMLNAGFLIAPFLSTFLLERAGFSGIFAAAVILYAVVFLIGLVSLRNFSSQVENRSHSLEILRKVWNRKNILRIYYVSFALEFFYALMVIFTPLYLINLGLTWREIGFIFTIMLTPFVLFQYPIGYLADRWLGEKEMIMAALVITAFSTAFIYFTDFASVFFWSVLLFLTRVGAALLEILKDSYFYKRIESQDIDLIDFFRTARAGAYIAGAFASSLFLLFFPLKSIFLLVAVIVLSAILPAWRLVDNKSEKEIMLKGCQS